MELIQGPTLFECIYDMPPTLQEDTVSTIQNG